MIAGMTLMIALLALGLPVAAAAEVRFLVPVEIEAVRGAARVNVDCMISRSPIRAEIGDSVDYSTAATVRNRVAIDLSGSAAEDGWQTFRGGRCFLSTEVPSRTEAEFSFAYSGVIERQRENATDAPDTPAGVAQ